MARSQPLEDRSAWPTTGYCPVEKTIGLIGSRAAMLILREAFYGTCRFDDFVERVDVSPATAAARLKTLTEAGLLERQPYQEEGSRPREAYTLTAAGQELLPVLVALYNWGARHTDVPKLIELVHEGCGHSLDVEVTCRKHPGERIGPADVDLRWRRRRSPD
jgi:DNA-binding HxlR family transcriptional regulator